MPSPGGIACNREERLRVGQMDPLAHGAAEHSLSSGRQCKPWCGESCLAREICPGSLGGGVGRTLRLVQPDSREAAVARARSAALIRR